MIILNKENYLCSPGYKYQDVGCLIWLRASASFYSYNDVAGNYLYVCPSVRHTFDSHSVSQAFGTQCHSVSHAFGTCHSVSHAFGTCHSVSHANGTQSHWCHSVSHAFGTDNISVLSTYSHPHSLSFLKPQPNIISLLPTQPPKLCATLLYFM